MLCPDDLATWLSLLLNPLLRTVLYANARCTLRCQRPHSQGAEPCCTTECFPLPDCNRPPPQVGSGRPSVACAVGLSSVPTQRCRVWTTEAIERGLTCCKGAFLHLPFHQRFHLSFSVSLYTRTGCNRGNPQRSIMYRFRLFISAGQMQS